MRDHARLVGIAFLVVLAAGVPAATAQMLFSIDRDTAELSQLDPSDAAVMSHVDVTLPAAPNVVIEGATGLTVHPTTLVLYGLLKLEGQMGRELVTIDPTTGFAVSIGDTGDSFASISFDAAGVLYGVTGQQGPNTETLYQLSLVDASSTFVDALDVAGPGEAIAIKRNTGDLYRASDITATGHLYQKIDLDTFATTDITVTGDDYGEATAMAWAGGNVFYLTDTGGQFFRITTSGAVTHIGGFGRGGGGPGPGEDSVSKGLAYIPIPEPTGLALLAVAGVIALRRGALR